MSTKTGGKEMWVSALCVSFFLSSCLSFCQRISHRTTTGPPEGRLQDPHMAWRREKERSMSLTSCFSWYRSISFKLMRQVCIFFFFPYILTNSKWRLKKACLLYTKTTWSFSPSKYLLSSWKRHNLFSLRVCILDLWAKHIKKMIPKKLYSNARQSRLILGFFDWDFLWFTLKVCVALEMAWKRISVK